MKSVHSVLDLVAGKRDAKVFFSDRFLVGKLHTIRLSTRKERCTVALDALGQRGG